MRLGIAAKVALILGAFIILGVSLVGWVLTQDSSRALRELSLNRLDGAAELARRDLHSVFDGAQRDVRLLLASRDVRAFAAGRAGHIEAIAELFQSMLLKQPWYTQVRLIGAAEGGPELVSIERLAERAHRTPPGELQAKGHRYYFREVLALAPGQVYFSRLDLNRENGSVSAVAQPVLRVAAPVYTPDRRHALAMVIINIDMQQVFARLRTDVPQGAQLLVANNEGDYLVHPDQHKQFAFEAGLVERIQQDFPALAQADFSEDATIRLQQESADLHASQVAAFNRVGLPGSADDWLTLGITEPLARVEAEVGHLLERSFWVTGALGLLAAVSALLLVLLLTRPLREVTRAVAAFRGGEGSLGPLPLQRHDEVGELARSFQEMAARIHTQMQWLNEEHDRLDTLIETAADAIVLTDHQGIIERCNSATSRLFGYELEEMLGNNVNMLMNPTDQARHDDYLARYLSTGEARIIGIGREVVGRHKDGHELPVYLSIGEFEVSGERRFTGILHDMSARRRLEEDLRAQANTDPLTGINNRRYFLEQLQQEIQRARRYGNQLSMLLIDLDNFKQINDRFGHAAGDQVLQRAVALLAAGLRSPDILARFGGDEFAALLPETDLETARQVAQRLCDDAANTPVMEDGSGGTFSFSIGVTMLADEEGALIRDADAALYDAKAAGRGGVVVKSEDSSD